MKEELDEKVFPFEEKYTTEMIAEKYGVEIKKVEKRLRWFCNAVDKHRHTKQYVLKNLYESGLGWTNAKGIILKEDFIEGYYESRKKAGKPIFNYDFSKLPDIITNKKTKVPIFVNEISTKTKKIIGDWETCYKGFVNDIEDNGQCAGMLSKEKTAQYIDTETFIARSKELFPGKFGYDRTKYVNFQTKVVLQCLTCGEYFEQRPGEHFYGTGQCPKCARKSVGRQLAMTQEEFIRRVRLYYSEDELDLSKAIYERGQRDGSEKDNRVIVIDPKTGEEYLVPCTSLLSGSFHFDDTRSTGEQHIQSSLTELNIVFNKEVKLSTKDIPELIGIRSYNIFVDFMFKHNNKTYIVEYNGTQHYYYTSFFNETVERFNNQLKRDEALRNYCKRSNIELIEIPYTIKTKERILDLLTRILVNGEDIDSVVPKLKPVYEKE